MDGLEGIHTMRKVYIPLTVLGLGGVSLLLLSGKGRGDSRLAGRQSSSRSREAAGME